MRIFVYKTLVDYYTKHPKAKTALEEWFCKTKKSEWKNFVEMKETFNSVDSVGNRRYVFNVKGNAYRIVAIVLFTKICIYTFYRYS